MGGKCSIIYLYSQKRIWYRNQCQKMKLKRERSVGGGNELYIVSKRQKKTWNRKEKTFKAISSTRRVMILKQIFQIRTGRSPLRRNRQIYTTGRRIALLVPATTTRRGETGRARRAGTTRRSRAGVPLRLRTERRETYRLPGGGGGACSIVSGGEVAGTPVPARMHTRAGGWGEKEARIRCMGSWW